MKEVKSFMWVYVLVGNIIRGMGETPIMPLGISYIEDFSKSENSPLYIGKSESLFELHFRTASSLRVEIVYLHSVFPE